MDEKLKEVKERVESAISDSNDDSLQENFEVEYWEEMSKQDTLFHGLDLVFIGSYVELYYEPVENGYKDDPDEILRHISGMLYFLSEDIAKIQNNLPDRHDT